MQLQGAKLLFFALGPPKMHLLGGGCTSFYHNLACDRRELLKLRLCRIGSLLSINLACSRRELSAVFSALGPVNMHLLGGGRTSFYHNLVCDRRDLSAIYPRIGLL